MPPVFFLKSMILKMKIFLPLANQAIINSNINNLELTYTTLLIVNPNGIRNPNELTVLNACTLPAHVNVVASTSIQVIELLCRYCLYVQLCFFNVMFECTLPYRGRGEFDENVWWLLHYLMKKT